MSGVSQLALRYEWGDVDTIGGALVTVGADGETARPASQPDTTGARHRIHRDMCRIARS
jgi:hypothetical protein